MISSRWFKCGVCAVLLALAVPMLAQDHPVITSENADSLARTIPSERFAEGSRGLRAVPDSSLFVYENYTSYDEEAERELYAAAEGAPGPVFPQYPPSYTVLDYTQGSAYNLHGYWTLSPDGRLWAAYYHQGEPLDGPTDLQIIDVATAEVISTLSTDAISTAVQYPASVRFSPGSNFLVLNDGEFTIWNARTGEPLDIEITGDKIAFNADDTLLLDGRTDATSGDLTVKVWDTETGDLRHTLEKANFGVRWWVIQTAPHQNLALFISPDVNSLWNLDTGDEIAIPSGYDAFFSDGGRTYLNTSGIETSTNLHVWDVETQEVIALHTLDAGNTNVIMDQAGSRVVFYAKGLNALVIDGVTGEQIAELRTRDLGPAVFSPDGTLLVTWKGRFFTIWSLDTGEALAEYEMANPDDVPETTVEIDDLQFSADGRVILLLPTFGTVEIWTVKE